MDKIPIKKSFTSNDEPLVSIIIPVYNVEKYLSACLDSVLSQTYKNIEVICVNDGTLDSSEKIIDTYISRDSRVKKINQKNSGLNMARANGYKISVGEYITFVDSDDLIHNKTIEIALNNIMQTDSDISVFGYKSFVKNISEINPKITKKNKVIKTKKEKLKYLLVNDPDFTNSTLQLTVWGKLYKRSVINCINWGKTNYKQHEDIFWTPYAFNSSTYNICLNCSNFYFYRRNQDSSHLSKAITGNSINNRKVGYLELVHNFADLLKEILDCNNLTDSLAREYDDCIYGMYRGNIQDLIDNRSLMVENNDIFMAEYFYYSEIHVKNLINTINSQDKIIKYKELQIDNMGKDIIDLKNKLNPKNISIKRLIVMFMKKYLR